MTAPAAPAGVPRSVISLNDGWKFHHGDVTVLGEGEAAPEDRGDRLVVPAGGSGAESPGFDDSGWEAVDVPHGWQGGPMRRDERFGNGPAWYRKSLAIPDKLQGRRVFLRFKAISRYAQVFLNGGKIGEHKGGFQAFALDITDQINWEGENLLAVRADVSSLGHTIMPLSGDFMIYCGIYRGVELIDTAPLHITPLDDGSSGVYIRPVEVAAEKAVYDVAALVSNSGSSSKSGRVNVQVRDADGKIVTRSSSKFTVQEGHNEEIVIRTTLSSPRLWNGRIDPHLYQVTVSVMHDGETVDAVTENLGVRFFRLDDETGTFFLNGKPYDLHGVAMHQDIEDRAWALTEDDYRRNIELVTELGATCLRCAHYPHARETYELCDRAGLLVWAENGNVDWCNFGDEAYTANFMQQTREMVKQNFNHPSIILWSLQNEVGLGGDKDPEIAGRKQAVNLKGFIEADAMVRRLDPSRLTTGAASSRTNDELIHLFQAAAYNKYPGWYGGDPDDHPKILAGYQERIPGRAFAVSEYGAGASIYQHEAGPISRPPSRGYWHPEEYQSLVHERAWLAMKDLPLWGTFVWNLCDFGVSGRREGDRPGINDKGLVTYDRKVRKDAFFFYKSRWTTEPMVHVTERRFTLRPSGKTVIKIYSNCPEVELIVNGVSAGMRPEEEQIFRWTIDLPEGEVKIEAVGHGGEGAKPRDTCTWTCGPHYAPVFFSKTPEGFPRAPESEVSHYVNPKNGQVRAELVAFSEMDDERTPAKLLDSRMATTWSTPHADAWAVFKVDRKVGAVELSWPPRDKEVRPFALESSADGKTWRRIFTGVSKPGTEEFIQTYKLDSDAGPFIKLILNPDGRKGWINLCELDFLASPGG